MNHSAGAFDGGDCLLTRVIGVPAFDCRLGLAALALARQEDRAAILRANVVALAVELGRIVGAQEHVEQVGERNDVGIEGDLDRFGMAGPAAADLLVGGIGLVAADVPALDVLNADDVVHHRLGAPEAAAGQDRGVDVAHGILLRG